MEETIKECPCCGEKVDFEHNEYNQNTDPGDDGMGWVRCGGCGLKIFVEGKKLLDAYRFVFSNHFLKDDKLVSALQTWQPDIYNLIFSDIDSGG